MLSKNGGEKNAAVFLQNSTREESMTEKLYDLDSYVTEFDCKVISLYKDERYTYIETDRTAFFPEGGGQTSDRGVLGGVYVENVQIIDGKIVHIVENDAENVEKLSLGAEIFGKIDLKKRFSDMQQHTGEHIFSGIVHSLFGFDNVGFHLSAESVTVDFNGEMSDEDICKAENLVNEAIWKNLEIKVSYPSKAELSSLSYRSKKEIDGDVRIVEIPGVDVCACCAPHVKRTGEVGFFRIIKSERHRGGMRFFILCGERAMLDAREKLLQNYRVSNLLVAKETETFSAVSRLFEERTFLAAENSALKREISALKAKSIEGGEKIVVQSETEDMNEARNLADKLSQKAEKFAAVLFGKNAERYVIISKTGFELSALCKALNAAFSGRGGGRDGIVQGSLASPEGAKEFLEEFD